MAKYIKAVEAAEKVAAATGIPLADLVDVFCKSSSRRCRARAARTLDKIR